MDAATRRLVRDRAGNRCEYCRIPQDATPFLTFHVDHVHASQHISDDSPENTCLSCPHCNLRKGPNLTSLLPDTREIVELFHPRKHVWSEHFELDGPIIRGLTDIGEVTVRLLEMNADEQVQIRASLLLRSEF